MFRYPLRRLSVLIPILAIVFTLVSYFAQPANAESAGEASLSAVSCSNEHGAVTVTLTAYSTGTDPVSFMLLIDNVSEGDDLLIPVTPGTPKNIPISNLEDGTHRVEVIVNDQTVFDQSFPVACDTAPTDSYSNPQGSVNEFCGVRAVMVYASNKPIGNNMVDLQPVTFTVTFVGNDSSAVRTLDTFTLPSGQDDAFDTQRSYPLEGPGVVSLYADGMTPVHTYYTGACMVVPDVVHHHKHKHHKKHHAPTGSALPNTGK
jgi:hypothetical protein